MAKYLAMTQDLLKKFSSRKLSNVDRIENQWADSLAKLASSNLKMNLDPVYVDSLKSPAIDILMVRNIQSNPAGEALFSMLYRRALTEPLLRCLSPEEADQAILKVHTGICGEHLGGKNLALKIMRQGMYWPTLQKDCESYVRKCQACQRHMNVSH
ncbi:uncharacterized protein LOC141665425 [Apium graveolens]|uniref:uncharacterized protein LOC141665425 n=1 Tax=Apium graveolens TaxID=4045 RepID=UPI003D7C0410